MITITPSSTLISVKWKAGTLGQHFSVITFQRSTETSYPSFALMKADGAQGPSREFWPLFSGGKSISDRTPPQIGGNI